MASQLDESAAAGRTDDILNTMLLAVMVLQVRSLGWVGSLRRWPVEGVGQSRALAR
jgi:hypothetical protein